MPEYDDYSIPFTIDTLFSNAVPADNMDGVSFVRGSGPNARTYNVAQIVPYIVGAVAGGDDGDARLAISVTGVDRATLTLDDFPEKIRVSWGDTPTVWDFTRPIGVTPGNARASSVRVDYDPDRAGPFDNSAPSALNSVGTSGTLTLRFEVSLLAPAAYSLSGFSASNLALEVEDSTTKSLSPSPYSLSGLSISDDIDLLTTRVLDPTDLSLSGLSKSRFDLFVVSSTKRLPPDSYELVGLSAGNIEFAKEILVPSNLLFMV